MCRQEATGLRSTQELQCVDRERLTHMHVCITWPTCMCASHDPHACVHHDTQIRSTYPVGINPSILPMMVEEPLFASEVQYC